jgi:uncharacterized membrane protein YphA (DoxX/SURF4 family)
MDTTYNKQSYYLAGFITLSLRLVVGWTYFSAFWRRIFLKPALDPEFAGYLGHKFNHFLPNSLGIKPIIEYLLLNPDSLWIAMVIFTIIEGVVGLCFMLGLFTRAMSIWITGLALGILLSAGWLGTTCLDEWQIGILGIAAGFTIFLSGSGKYSIDYWLIKKNKSFTESKWFGWLGSGVLPIKMNSLNKLVITGSIVILFITLFTNQHFHGGIWGPLHNMSVKPKVEISNVKLVDKSLSFQLYRVEGVDVYGSFLIDITLTNKAGEKVMQFDANALSKFPKKQISNLYISKIKPGKHSMILPLGAKGTLTIMETVLGELPKGEYTLKLTDVSGKNWSAAVVK